MEFRDDTSIKGAHSLALLMDRRGSSTTLVMEGAWPRDRLLLLLPLVARLPDPRDRLLSEEEREREPCTVLRLCLWPTLKILRLKPLCLRCESWTGMESG